MKPCPMCRSENVTSIYDPAAFAMAGQCNACGTVVWPMSSWRALSDATDPARCAPVVETEVHEFDYYPGTHVSSTKHPCRVAMERAKAEAERVRAATTLYCHRNGGGVCLRPGPGGTKDCGVCSRPKEATK